MSFSAQVKEELCRTPLSRRCCARAEAYGILLFCHSFTAAEIKIVTSAPVFAKRLPALFRKAFKVDFDRTPEPAETGKRIFLIMDPGKLAATVFTGGCDLRCPFCHNALLVTRLAETPEIPVQEVLDFLASRKGLLDGVVLTGGEPLLQPDAAEFLQAVRELGFAVKLDTNGCHPAALAEILEAGLADYVAMDVKNSPGRYGETAGTPGLDLAPFRESVSFLLRGTVDYEFRTTVVREFHDADSFKAIGPWIAGAKRYFLQSFVDRDTVLREGLHPWDGETLGSFADLVRPYVEQVELRGV